MSDVESDILLPVVAKAPPPVKIEEPRPATEALDFTESEGRGTQIPYDPEGRVPWPLIALWVVALSALGLYTILYLLPDLAKWGHP